MEYAKQPRILIIEDNPAIADLIGDALEEHGYRCVTATDADRALRLIDAMSPDLITLDLGLPGISGRRVLQVIRGNPHTRDIPVIIVSAERAIEAHVRAVSQAVIPKPFEVDHLVAVIQQELSTRAGAEQAREVGREVAPQPAARARPHSAAPHHATGSGHASAGASE